MLRCGLAAVRLVTVAPPRDPARYLSTATGAIIMIRSGNEHRAVGSGWPGRRPYGGRSDAAAPSPAARRSGGGVADGGGRPLGVCCQDRSLWSRRMSDPRLGPDRIRELVAV